MNIATSYLRTQDTCYNMLNVMVFQHTAYIFVVVSLYLHIVWAGQPEQQRLILISLDGFGANLINKTETPAIDWITQNGISVDYMKNVFPTSTIPNHQSIVTGLYPEHHGIIDNRMYNQTDGSTFSLNNTDSIWWEGATPIWITNQNQGHKSGVAFWPGYNVSFHGEKPAFTPSSKYGLVYAHESPSDMPLRERVDLVLSWIKADPSTTFLVLYDEEPDSTLHEVSPDTNNKTKLEKLQKVIKAADHMISTLLMKLKRQGLENTTNIIVLGDHGQVTTTYERVFNLSDYINFHEDIQFTSGFTIAFIYAKNNKTDYVYNKLRNANQHIKVYLKKDIPDRLHIKNNIRTPDILLLSDPGWVIIHKDIVNDHFIGHFQSGVHGYSNDVPEMWPIFRAYGPAFRKSVHRKCVNIVDLYEMMCHILKISPLKNNGDFNRVKWMLKEYAETDGSYSQIDHNC